MRNYRNGELVGYSDEVVVVTREQYEQDDYPVNGYEYETVLEACKDIEDGEVDLDDNTICVVEVKEYYDGTDYILKAEYAYDEEEGKWKKLDNKTV